MTWTPFDQELLSQGYLQWDDGTRLEWAPPEQIVNDPVEELAHAIINWR